MKKNIFKKKKYLKQYKKIVDKNKSKRKNIKKDKIQKRNYFNIIKLVIIIIISILLYKRFIFLNKYKYCYDCIKNKTDKNEKCLECPNEILCKHLYIVSPEKTLDEIVKYNRSIARFGDGEIGMIFGGKTTFQKYDINLSKRLLEVLNAKDKNLLIGIYFPYQKKKFDTFKNISQKLWNIWFYENKFKMLNILKNRKYYSADISRFYSHLRDKSKVYKYIPKLKKIWEGRDVLVIEGEKTRFGIGNDLLNNSKSIRRILCPTKHAYNVYDKIVNAALKFDKSILILIALGPAATVLAHDLNKFGYQAVDIGHADIQYELYLRKASKHILIPYKYVNEYRNGINEKTVGKAPDIRYYDQIIDKILF